MCNRKPIAKLIAGLFLVFVCSTALAQQPESGMDPHSKTLKIDVDLVLVNATVSDPQGRMVYWRQWEGHYTPELRVTIREMKEKQHPPRKQRP